MSFTVYKSSAGSGKTFTLVKEYLKIVLLEPDKYKHILAITFTNKAAGEMRNRIVDYLEILANPSSEKQHTIKSLTEELQEETKFDTITIANNASIVLSLILHNYSNFAVSTIDSFVYKIIKSFAFDLHIPLSFEVEMDQENVLEKCIDLLISKIGSDEKLTLVLIKFLEGKADNEKSWHIEKDLLSTSKLLLSEKEKTHIDQLKTFSLDDFISFHHTVGSFCSSFENNISAIANKASQLINDNTISTESFYRGSQGIAIYFLKLQRGDFDSLLPNSYVNDTIQNDKWYSAKASVEEKSRIDNIKEALRDHFQKIQEQINKDHSTYIIYQLLMKNLYPLAVLNEIEKIATNYKKENQLVFISEFNQLISSIILEEPVPFIYERVGEKYNHLLIDEFQDTSTLQFQNMLPLLDNSLAEGHFNMIVGDSKQAIYRFRGGDAEQLEKLPEVNKKNHDSLLAEREQSLIAHHQPKKLINNYRSCEEVVKFNNTFFSVLAESLPETYKSYYKDVVQQINPHKKGGFVRIRFIEKSKTQKNKKLYIQQTKETIQEILNQGFSKKDIAILCRSNANASAIARELLEDTIPVISSESILLKQSKEVNFIVACLIFLNNTNDALAKAVITEFLFQNHSIKKSTLHEVLSAITDSSAKKTFFNDWLNQHGFSFDLNTLKSLPIYDLCEELIRTFNLNKTSAYLQFFLDAVLKYTTTDQSNIANFIEWWEEKKDNLSVVVPEGSDAITIMTIHKAKGLEFPIVVYPFANEKVDLTRSSLWVNPQQKNELKLDPLWLPAHSKLKDTIYASSYNEEHDKLLVDIINVLYVALTRASERLYVISEKPSDKAKLESIPALLKHYLTKTNCWDETKLTYSFGEESHPAKSHVSEKAERFVLKSFITNNWRDRIHLRTKAPDVWDFENMEPNLWGNIVHYALSKINTIDDLTKITDLISSEGIVEEKDKKRLSDQLFKVIHHPNLSPFFTKGLRCKNEAEILLTDGSTFRPDRIIFHTNKTIILDYKTGKPFAWHKQQLNKYADLLQAMGYPSVEKHIIYINDDVQSISC